MKKKRKSKNAKFIQIEKLIANDKTALAIGALILVVLFVGVFFATTGIFKVVKNEHTTDAQISKEPTKNTEITTEKPQETTKSEQTQPQTTTEPETTTVNNNPNYTPGNVSYPENTDAWQLICVNRYRYVDSDTENKIKLSYVSGSGEQMDYRAAEAYEKMYSAAKEDGYYLTPCSGYRSYSTQKRLYNEFFYQYINQGYSEEEAHNLTSNRRNPAGSSEHNLGICMDIICAGSSYNFENTSEYKWLCENAHKYGFILRYPEDKVDITNVKFEPWHWRYVGVENAEKIKNSGLCLEEYLGLS